MHEREPNQDRVSHRNYFHASTINCGKVTYFAVEKSHRTSRPVFARLFLLGLSSSMGHTE